MSKKSSMLGLIAGTILLLGCESKTGTGALAGAGSGAVVGGIIGGPEGAIIGGAAGGVAGGLVGAVLDNQEQKRLKMSSSRTYQRLDKGEKLSVDDIINLSKAHICDDKIISLIQKTGSCYTLNEYRIKKLREEKVPERVINYMMDTPCR